MEAIVEERKYLKAIKKGKPWIENIIIGSIVIYIELLYQIPFELGILYIFLMGVLYGIKHSIFAALVCCFSFSLKNYFEIQMVFNIITYFFIAFISSYAMSNIKFENNILRKSYKELGSLYEKQRIEVNHLQEKTSELSEKLILSENSFGKILGIIKEIRKMDVNEYEEKIPNIVSRLTGISEVQFYKLDQDSKLNQSNQNSILRSVFEDNLDYNSSIKKWEKDKNIIFNMEKKSFYVPILENYKGNLLGFLTLNEVPFEKLNESTEVFLSLISEFIADYYTQCKE